MNRFTSRNFSFHQFHRFLLSRRPGAIDTSGDEELASETLPSAESYRIENTSRDIDRIFPELFAGICFFLTALRNPVRRDRVKNRFRVAIRRNFLFMLQPYAGNLKLNHAQVAAV